METRTMIVFGVIAVLVSVAEAKQEIELTPYKETIEFGVITLADNLQMILEDFCKETPDFQPALEESVSRIEQIDIEGETVCSLIRNHLEYVFEPVVTAIDDCPVDKEAKVADFFLHSIVSVFDYICQSDGEHIIELVNPCLEQVDMTCVEDSSSMEKFGNLLYTEPDASFKEEICRAYDDVEPCVESSLKEACKAPVTRESLMGLLQAAFKSQCP